MAEAGRTVQRTAGNAAMAEVLRRGGDARHVQRMPRSGQASVLGQGGPLDGLDGRGNYYKFDHRDVRAKALRDDAGQIIGISFPTQPGDTEQVTAWAKAPNRTSDVEVYTVTMSGDVRRPTLSVGASGPAPWSSRPIYIHAHASNEFFSIPVETGSGVKALKVDGATFGEILRKHSGFREAARNTPGRDGLLMSCASGHPNATAAAEMAQHMHSKGSARTWHAPTGNGVRIHNPGSDRSAYGATQSWDFQGNEIPGGFVSFPPPPTTAQAPQPSGAAYAQTPGNDPYASSQYAPGYGYHP